MDDEPNEDWITELGTTSVSCGPSRKVVDLFTVASALIMQASSEDSTNIPRPLRTISIPWAAFNFNRRPDISWISVNSLAEKLNLPDLCPALLDFFSRCSQNPSVHRIGGQRRAHTNTQLPFRGVMVWHSFRMQTRGLDDGLITEPRRLNAVPPCDDWPLGRYDTALFVHDRVNCEHTPGLRLEGKSPNRFVRPETSNTTYRVRHWTDSADPPSNLGYGGS